MTRAACDLADLGSAAAPAIPALVRLLGSDPEGLVRSQAAWAIGVIGK